MTEEKTHEALENTFAHIVAESGEVVGGRNIIAHVTDVGQSVFMLPLTEMLNAMRDAFYEECGRAVAEWHGCSPAELCGCEKWVDSWVETTCDISQWYNTMFEIL